MPPKSTKPTKAKAPPAAASAKVTKKKAAPAPKKQDAAKKPAPKKETASKKPAPSKKQQAALKKQTKDGKGKKGDKKVEAKKPATQEKDSVWEKKPRNFGIGNDIQPRRDLTRFTRWPKYILLQRKKQVLQKRLKVPPSINQFTKTLDSNTAANVFKLLNKYRPEDKVEKRQRLAQAAKAKEQGKVDKDSKPIVVKSGINHVTKLIESKKAAFVVIAHDVDPIEIVLYLPALCRKQGIPYCIVKSKARLGQVVHKKTATALALTGVRNEDRQQFTHLVTIVRSQYNDKYEENRRRWGGGIMGLKTQAVLKRREKAEAKDEAEKKKYL